MASAHSSATIRTRAPPFCVRYPWSDITSAAARWAQAFSTDDGRTWETNWIMQLTRT